MFDRVHIDFGECTAFEAMDRLVAVEGLDVVDVGCGQGDLARALVERGARVTAVEPDETQARLNADAPEAPGLAFRQAAAEALPLADAGADGVFFSKSLHHVPAQAMDRALQEALRVLGDDGFLYVLEPDIEGPYSRLMQPFHDESEVRTAAREALRRTALPAFAEIRRAAFTVTRRYADFDEFAAMVTGLSYNESAYRRADVEAADVRQRFETGRDDTGYAFVQPMTVFLFSGKARDA